MLIFGKSIRQFLIAKFILQKSIRQGVFAHFKMLKSNRQGYSLFLKMYSHFSIRMGISVKSIRQKVFACEYFWGVRIKKKPLR